MIPIPTSQSLFQILERADHARLSSNHLRFLLLVQTSTDEDPTDGPTNIAKRMCISIASAGDISRILESRKLIIRKRNREDDRRVIYTLSKKGGEILDAVRTGENLDAIFA